MFRKRYLWVMLIVITAWMGATQPLQAACIQPYYFSSLDYDYYYYSYCRHLA